MESSSTAASSDKPAPAAKPAAKSPKSVPNVCKSVSKATLARWKKYGIPERAHPGTEHAREIYAQRHNEVLTAVDRGNCAAVGAVAGVVAENTML